MQCKDKEIEKKFSDYARAADVYLKIAGKMKDVKTWTTFSAAVGVTAIAVPQAEATIVYSGPIGATVGANGSRSIDLDNDGNPDFRFNNIFYTFTLGSHNGIFANATGTLGTNYVSQPGSFARIFGGGENIGPISAPTNVGYVSHADIYSTGFSTNRNFTASISGFLGVQFNAGLTGTNFAWIRVHVSAPSPVATLTIQDWAYEDNGSSIEAGVVPEPSSLALGSLGLLAMGVTGIRNYRNRRKHLTESTSN